MSDNDVTPEEQSEEIQVEAEDALPEEEGVSAGARDRAGSSPTSSLEAERDSYRDIAQRLQADFENYKKRIASQEKDRVARAEESLVIKLLPVLDTIDLALAHDPNGSLEQVRTSLIDVLKKSGLESVAEVDAAFDPTLHEAVAHEPGEGEQRVSEIMRAGYKWNGRVVRPAMVKVIGS